jgi:hypothetical protein
MNDEPEKVIHINTPKLLVWIVSILSILIVGGMLLYMYLR